MTISPRPARVRMLRPISEVAVAISVGSGRRKPSRVARARPSARACTKSTSVEMGTRISSLIPSVPLGRAIEHRERLVSKLPVSRALT
jgi:hypothetical protein